MNTMIDLETLDVEPKAVILSIGLVAYYPDKIADTLYLIPSIQDQLNLGRTISESTLKWWMQQSSEARAIFSQQTSDFKWCMEQAALFLGQHRGKVWSHGANFDTVLIASALKDVGIKNPYQYWDVRCFRTWMDEYGVKMEKRTGVHHHALDDAKTQAQLMIDTRKKKKVVEISDGTLEV